MGYVTFGERWGKLWAEHQNSYFREKSLDLRVDPTGIVAQNHLGPVRMRDSRFAILDQEKRIELNQLQAKDPQKILAKLTETTNIFKAEEVEKFLLKHVPVDNIEQVREEFWQQGSIKQLLDQKSGQALNQFTTTEILDEEKKILRLGESLHAKAALKVSPLEQLKPFAQNLISEQRTAFAKILIGQALSCLEGYAGTGKSYLLSALKNIYESEGYTVRAFCPDHATVQVLKEKEFDKAKTLHRFLFLLQHGKTEIKKQKEVWILDEAGKIGNRPILELLKAAKQHGVQLILAGDSAQMSAVDRGCMFHTFSKQFRAQALTDIQRQQNDKERLAAKHLATGNMSHAIDLLVQNGNFVWSSHKDESKENLIHKWVLNQATFPGSSSIIIAHTNQEVRELNELVRLYRQEKGELGKKEFLCESLHGKILVSTGDQIEFRGNDRDLGVTNGMRGQLIEASAEQFTVLLKESNNRKVSFNPQEYWAFQLAYASTNFRVQGATVDRAYVLHSKGMDKPGFYVALTRQVKKASLFISRDEVSCLAQLKRQAQRQTSRSTTLDFTTHEELSHKRALTAKQDRIQSLKDSSSIFTKAKGYTLSIWDQVKTKLQSKAQQASDLKPDELKRALKFYPSISNKETLTTFLEAKDVLYRVEERLRSRLENDPQKKPWEINQAILKETLQILGNKKSLSKQLQIDPALKGQAKDKVAYHMMLHQASIGKPLSNTDIEKLNCLLTATTETHKGQLATYIQNKAVANILGSSYSFAKEPLADLVKKEAAKIDKQLAQITQPEQFESTRKQQKQLELDL